ncbi:hypothetical protein [Sinomonas mesophila]|uniref:hypothetical protein n=1 Tax=Sinomonas mesophila TaxID=1531955 RepID=UPI000986D80B|nr:hypothetical protein [Sinomonas mesophila]
MFQPNRGLSALGTVFTLLLAMATVASCATPGSPQPPTTSAPATSSPPASTPAPTDAQELCGPGSAINFDKTAFPASPKIDNQWFPLKPGMQYTTTGTVEAADGTTERIVTHTVTGLTKVIDGVKTLVMWDRDYQDGALVESELAFFAQDNAGTVWLFGEYPEEFENDVFIGAPNTFIHGISGSQAGIAMQAQPQTRTRTPEYVQGHAPSVGFLDCARTISMDVALCVPAGCYGGLLEINERNPLEPAVGNQRKFYSAGTGLVKVTAIGGERQETLDLTKAEQLSDAQLAEVNAQALDLDEHGYEVSKDVYAQTPRAEAATEGAGRS